MKRGVGKGEADGCSHKEKRGRFSVTSPEPKILLPHTQKKKEEDFQ